MEKATTEQPAQDALPPGWSLPKPETLPHPTYAPIMLAAGIILLLWGVVTSWMVSLAGLGLLTLALIIWIGALRHGD